MTTLARIETLNQELIALEAQLAVPNLLPAAQAALDDEWEHRMCELEMLSELLANDLEDTRQGCDQCSGCMYCEESSPGYDEDDEM